MKLLKHYNIYKVYLLIAVSLLMLTATVAMAQSPVKAQSDIKPQSPVKARYIEEIELVSIAAHLAEANGYDWGAEDVGVEDYLADVDSTFAPYRQHPVVAFICDNLHNEGFNWHFPMHFALRLSISDGMIKYNEQLDGDFDGYYERITPENEKKLISLLQDFYDTTKFHEFYLRHMPLYRDCEAAMQRVIDQIDFGWYDRFFGPREGSTFCIYPNIIIGPANYAVHQKGKDGSEVINAVMGCCMRNSKGAITYDTYSTLPIIIHECNHSYCNPLNEEFWPQMEERAVAFFNKNAQHYTDEAYGNALYVLNETFVEACVMRYLMSHPFDFSENSDKWISMLGISDEALSDPTKRQQVIQDTYLNLLTEIDYKKKRFYMIHDVIKALAERERHADLYPTMRHFMPQYIKVVNGFSSSSTDSGE